MNCIIIDDEKHCIKTLTNLLKMYFPEITVIETCNESPKAYDLIRQHQPAFIFLDIEMPLLNGFDLLSRFDKLNFDVIFTTAYDSYAIKAIKYSALDYLLKPVDKEDLAFAIEKIKSRHNTISQSQVQMAIAVHNKQMPDTIALPTLDGLVFSSVYDIIYCIAEGSYTRIYLPGIKEVILSRTLGNVEEILSDYNFFRIHHSTLINLRQVKKYIRGEGGEVLMSNGSCLKLSRNRKRDFLNVFARA